MEDIKLRWLSEKSYWAEKKRTDVDYHPEKDKNIFMTTRINI
ncbi:MULTISPECIES: hypothetical protein [unclassified Granulicatella]|nr:MULTISPECIES: hypothetical protein [unclassified Granulicatella]